MDKFKATMARQVARAAIALHQHKTGRMPKLVTVALSGVMLAVIPRRVSDPAQSVFMEF